MNNEIQLSPTGNLLCASGNSIQLHWGPAPVQNCHDRRKQKGSQGTGAINQMPQITRPSKAHETHRTTLVMLIAKHKARQHMEQTHEWFRQVVPENRWV
jgi:hypothetical protein